jgi:subtilase family serine protease
MSKRMITAAVAAVAGLVIAGAGAVTAANAGVAPTSRALAGSAVPFTSTARSTGAVAGTSKLTIQLWLTPRTAAAEAYATAVSTPGSAAYGEYLSPSEYAARYGATAAEASSAQSWLKSQGFTGISTNAERDYVTATAPVSVIQTAFKTTIRYYQPSATTTAGRARLYANASALTLPSSLSGIVLGVTGLNDAEPILPIERPGSVSAKKGITPAKTAAGPTYPCSAYYGQHTATLTFPKAGTTYPTQLCGYDAAQLRAAYGANTTNTGKGQTIALVELGLTPGMFGTLQKYAASNGLPAPSASRYKELNIGNVSFAACGDAFYGEESLDVEAAYDMAPAATDYVIGGDGCTAGYGGVQGLFDADLAVINGNGKKPLANIASNSWGSGGEAQAPVITTIEHAYLVKAAAEGVGEYFSSGDGPGTFEPASDPYAISVGGTSLGVGKTANRLFETGWSDQVQVDFAGTWLNFGINGAAGGGPSTLWSQPSYQKGIVPKALATVAGNRSSGPVRSVPDISADADPYTGILLLLQNLSSTGAVTGYVSEAIGGTSLASPLVAGIVAAAQQGQAKQFGFLDPALYKLAHTSAFNDALPITTKSPAAYHSVACDVYYCGLLAISSFDNQNFTTPGYNGQVTLKGYDNMTGLGTPAGQTFITDLRALLK